MSNTDRARTSPPSMQDALSRLEALKVRADALIGERPAPGSGPVAPADRRPPRAPRAKPLSIVPDDDVPVSTAPTTATGAPADPGRVAAQVASARAEIEILRGEVDRERAGHAELVQAAEARAAQLEGELDAERDTVAALRARVDELTAELDRLLADGERRETEWTQKAAELLAAYDAEVARAQALVADLDASAAALEDERVARSVAEAELQAAHEEALDAQRADFDVTLADLRRTHADDAAGLRSELEQAQAHSAEVAARFAAEVEGVATQLDELERMSADLRARAERAEAEREAAVADAAAQRTALEVERDELRASLEGERDRLRASLEGERDRLRTTLESERDEIRAELMAERAVRERTEQQRRESEAARAAAETKVEQSTVRVVDLEARLAERTRAVERLQAESRAHHDALVGAQRQIAEAQVQLAGTRQELDRERLARGETDARIVLERTEFEERLRVTEFAGRQALESERSAHALQREQLAARLDEAEQQRTAALDAERDRRRTLQQDLQSKLETLKDELRTTTQALRRQLEQEREALGSRVRELEARIEAEADATLAARRDRDELLAGADELEAAVAQLRSEADASGRRCTALEEEIARRDAMLQRATSLAGELREELDALRTDVATREGVAVKMTDRAQQLAARAAALVEQARGVYVPGRAEVPTDDELGEGAEAPLDPPASPSAADVAGIPADATPAPDPATVPPPAEPAPGHDATATVSSADEADAPDTDEVRAADMPDLPAPATASVTPEPLASLDELVQRIERLKAQGRPDDRDDAPAA